MGEKCALKEGLTRGAIPLAARASPLDAGLRQRVQHELDVLHTSTDCVVDHLQRSLVCARFRSMTGLVAARMLIHSLLLLRSVDLFIQVVTLQYKPRVRNETDTLVLTYEVLLELVEVIDHVAHGEV